MSERRCSWTIRVPGYPPFVMGGEACTRDEALYCARLIWPQAEIEI